MQPSRRKQRDFSHSLLRQDDGGYLAFAFRQAAKPVNVCSSVAG
jgi:hypothetical protein